MHQRIGKASLILLATASCLTTFPCKSAMAQQVTNALGDQKVTRRSGVTSRQEGAVRVRLERGGKVAVDNRTTGRIVVIGWDKDFVEARATSERGEEAVRFSVERDISVERDNSLERDVSLQNDSSVKSVWLKADYAKREESVGTWPGSPQPQPRPEATPSAPAPSPTPVIPVPPTDFPRQIRMPGSLKYDGVIEPPLRGERPLEVHLEVRVPRYAEIELIKVKRSDVEITGVETPLTILGAEGDVILKNVGAVEVRTRNGPIEVENASGLVDVVTASGLVRVRRAGGDVRVLSINGPVEIECVRGRVNVDSTSGAVKLDNIHGDVDANTSNGDVLFTGALREDGRYHLKSMSGAVVMALRDKPPGFTAALSSYRGPIENEIQLKIKQGSSQEESINRRIVGRYGDGQAQITLDTFDGRVKLSKLAAGQVKDCK